MDNTKNLYPRIEHMTQSLSFQSYTGGDYTYWCEALPLSALSDSVWHVVRKNDSAGQILHADTGGFTNKATDLSTVAALTYTLGS